MLLKFVLVFPTNWNELGEPWQEKRIALFIDCPTLLRAYDERDDFFTSDCSRGVELVGINQGHEALKACGLALVGRCRKQEQIRRGFRQGLAQTVAGDWTGPQF